MINHKPAFEGPSTPVQKRKMLMMNLNSVYLGVFISLLTISTATGNYGYGQQYGTQNCNRSGYERAREMIRLELQQQRSHNPMAPYDNPRYPGLSNSYQVNNYTNNRNFHDHQCKLMRQALDDMLINTPLCDPLGSYQFQMSSDLILQGRNYLLQQCERNNGWRFAECFRRREINECENRFDYTRATLLSSSNQLGSIGANYNRPANQFNQNDQYNNRPITYELCQAFELFRNCVVSHSRTQCYTSDLDLLGTYFIDKAGNASWSCIPSQISISPNLDVYSRRTDINYPKTPGSGYFPPTPLYAQAPNIAGSGTISPYQGGQNNPAFSSLNSIDRSSVLSGMNSGSVSACVERVRPFENSCLDHLIMRQREARYGRSSTDVQRRICCALFSYRDCLSRIVLERCFDTSRVTVDILMGDRNREVSQNCRDFTRDQCNKSLPLFASFNLLAILLVVTFFNNN